MTRLAHPFRLTASIVVVGAVLTIAPSVTAYNATGNGNATLTVWNPTANDYLPISLMLNAGVTESVQTNSSSSNNDDIYSTSESIWLADDKGNQVCTAPYTLCALAFTGGIGDSRLIAQMQSDTGNCATAFSGSCIGDLKVAVGNAVLDQGSNNGTGGEICSGISKAFKVPTSCSDVAVMFNQSTSQALLETSSSCGVSGDQPFAITSFDAPTNQLGSVLGEYDKYVESFTPILLVAFGGPQGVQIVAKDAANTRSLNCVRPGTVAVGSRMPGAASSSYHVSIGLLVGGLLLGLIL